MITKELTLGGEPLTAHLLDGSDAHDMLRFGAWLGEQVGPVGLDVEANGFDFYHPAFALTLVGFAKGDTAWVVVVNDDTFPYLRMAIHGDTTFVAHNAPYDALAVLTVLKTVPTTMADSLLAGLLETPPTDPTFRHGLKAYAAREGWQELNEAEEALHQRFTELGGDTSSGWALIDPTDEALWTYNALDAAACERLRERIIMRGDINTVRLLPSEEKLQWAWAGLTARGIKVDHDRLNELIDQTEEERQRLELELNRLGIDNPRSHDELTTFFSGHGAHFSVFTRNGNPSFSNDAVPSLTAPDQPDRVVNAATVLEAYLAAEGKLSKLLEIDSLSMWTGRVHPWVNTLKAKTGRMSLSGPALQNLPKGDMREVFVADEGFTLVGADLAQVEFRVAAALSRDPKLMEAIREGRDLHDATAEAIFGPGFTKQQRHIAKTVGFGTLYGGGAQALATQAHIPVETAQEVRVAFRKAYGQLHEWIDTLAQQEAVRTYSGRRIPVDEGFGYRAVNYLVQGTARDILADAVMWLVDAGWARYLWLPVHDEIILMVEHHRVVEAQLALEAAMSMTLMGVPIEATAEELGPRWVEAP